MRWILRRASAVCQPLQNHAARSHCGRSEIERFALHGTRFQKADKIFDRLDSRRDAVGVEDNVRHPFRQMARQDPHQADRRVDGKGPIRDVLETPLEQEHLHEPRVGQNGDRLLAGMELHYGKPRRVVTAHNKAGKAQLKMRRHLERPIIQTRANGSLTRAANVTQDKGSTVPFWKISHTVRVQMEKSIASSRAARCTVTFLPLTFCSPGAYDRASAIVERLAPRWNALKEGEMDAAALTKERVVALVVVVLNVAAALAYSHVSQNLGIVAGSAFLLSLPGLAIIWFREALSVTGFDRGVLHESPPLFLDVIGWLFLIALPIIFLAGLLP